MTPLRFLTQMRRHLTPPDMWMKGNYSHRGIQGAEAGDPCCLYGCMYYVRNQNRFEGPEGMTGSELFVAVDMIINMHIAPPGERSPGIPDFNDDPNTTHADVMAMLDECIAAEEDTA